MAFQPGDRIGGYEVVGELGAGGMGKVYRVRNLISQREEAMKILLPNLSAEPDLVDRFVREIRVQASLQHPNIATLNTAFEHQNQLVMVMELVSGVSLQERMTRGPLTLEESVNYTSQVLKALIYAHHHGVIHRDIKPANMMLTPDGVIKLLDFGIARAMVDRKLTRTGMAVGSVYYMAPEQIQGLTPDPRSDLYSLGIALYQFVTGVRPIDGDSDFAIMAAHVKEPPVPPMVRDARIPPAFSELILMALAKKPEQRFQTAEAFLNALEGVGRAAIPRSVAVPAQPPPLPAVAPLAGNYRAAYMVAGAVVALLVLGVVATQVPKWSGIHASAPIGAPATAAQPAALPPAQPSVEPSIQQSQVGPVEKKTPVSVENAKPARPVSPAGGAVAAGPVAASEVPQVQKPQPSAAQVPVQSPPPPPPAHSVETPVVQPAHSKEAAQLSEGLSLMSARITAVNQAIDSLRQAQAAQGLSPRRDLVSGQQLMQMFFTQANEALQAGDIPGGMQKMDRAEQNLEKLEKILGR